MHFMKRYVMLYVILLCCITKSRLDIQFVKKIFLEMVIGQLMNDQNY